MRREPVTMCGVNRQPSTVVSQVCRMFIQTSHHLRSQPSLVGLWMSIEIIHPVKCPHACRPPSTDSARAQDVLTDPA